jgi:hypothetical protein
LHILNNEPVENATFKETHDSNDEWQIEANGKERGRSRF